MKISCLLIIFIALLSNFTIAKEKELTPLGPIKKIGAMPFREKPEMLTFKISYLGLVGGYAQMSTVPNVLPPPELNLPTNNYIEFMMTAWTTPFVSKMYNLNMRLLSYSLSENFYCRYYKEDRQEKNHYKYHTLNFFPEKKTIKYKWKEKPIKLITYLQDGFDVVASFYIFRCTPLTPNSMVTALIYFRSKSYVTPIKVLDYEKINTAFGRKRTIVVIPQMNFPGLFLNKGEIKIYLSDDKYRIPLLMKSKVVVGSFKAKLIEGYPEE